MIVYLSAGQLHIFRFLIIGCTLCMIFPGYLILTTLWINRDLIFSVYTAVLFHHSLCIMYDFPCIPD